jgi:hypothetical protein
MRLQLWSPVTGLVFQIKGPFLFIQNLDKGSSKEVFVCFEKHKFYQMYVS